MFSIDLDKEKEELIARAATLAREKFAPRAAAYDQDAAFPAEDFVDLFEAGLLGASIPNEYGGLGLGPYSDDTFTLWMMTKELAKADLSLARCWEGHINSMVLLSGLATEPQKRRWFDGVLNRSEKWVAWSGEPQARTPQQRTGFGTAVTEVDGGFVVDGSKVFATSAGAADWAVLLVNTKGPGGARHANVNPEGLLLLACDLSDSSVSFDNSWWDPIGMRATVSHLARFDQTFIPKENAIGEPGEYHRGGWQSCFTPHYASSFLGAAEGAYEFGLDYLTTQKKTADPFVQQHIGQMSLNIEAGHLWLKRVAELWESGRHDDAKLAGARARYCIELLADETVRHCILACGARCLNRPSPLERIYRDLSFYVRHDNRDHILANIGRSLVGQTFDAAFFRAGEAGSWNK